MMKKQSKRNPAPEPALHASLLRWGEKSPEDLRRYAETLKKQAVELAAMAQAMEELGIASMRMDGVKKADQGLLKVDEFIGKLEYALNQKKREMRRG